VNRDTSVLALSGVGSSAGACVLVRIIVSARSVRCPVDARERLTRWCGFLTCFLQPPRQFSRPDLSLLRDSEDYLTRRSAYEQEVR
jgi:hypothetical protein